MIAQRYVRMGSRRAFKTLLGRARTCLGTHAWPRAFASRRLLEKRTTIIALLSRVRVWPKVRPSSHRDVGKCGNVCAHLRALFHRAFTFFSLRSPVVDNFRSFLPPPLLLSPPFFLIFRRWLRNGMRERASDSTDVPLFGHGCTFTH